MALKCYPFLPSSEGTVERDVMSLMSVPLSQALVYRTVSLMHSAWSSQCFLVLMALYFCKEVNICPHQILSSEVIYLSDSRSQHLLTHYLITHL